MIFVVKTEKRWVGKDREKSTLTSFIFIYLEALWTSAIIRSFSINAVASLANTSVLQALVDICKLIENITDEIDSLK